MALVAALLLLFPAAGPAARSDRALASYKAMQSHFQNGPLYRDRDGATPYTKAWPYSQLLAATIAVARLDPRFRDDVRSRIAGLDGYWNPSLDVTAYDSSLRPPFGGGGPQFYDDNEWIGLELVRAHELLGDPEPFARAAEIFEFVVSGWDGSTAHACPGGVFWTRSPRNTDRNTVSTANGALLALELYRLTGNWRYLRWGERMYEWVQQCLRGPDGLYMDHLGLTGEVDRREWSYNQGAMIGAGVRLFQLTGESVYLEEAQQLARDSLARFGPTEFRDEPPTFVAIFFRNLRLLESVIHDPTYAAAEQRYADSRWTCARDSDTGLFTSGHGRPSLLDQAAMVQIYADLASVS